MSIDLAWVAGLFDGEGSIGIKLAKRPNGGTYLVPSLQLEMTCKETVDTARERLQAIGVTALGYSYRERDPTKHQDGHYLRINRLADIERTAAALLPYAVTKRRQWEVVLMFVRSRLAVSTVGEDGKVKRGGHEKQKPFTEEEIKQATTMKHLNARGVEARKKARAWLAKAETVSRGMRSSAASRCALSHR